MTVSSASTNLRSAGPKEFIVLIALLMSVVALSIDALLPALGYIRMDLSVGHANQVQYLIGCIFIGMAVGQGIAGPLSDALGRKPVLYLGIALFIIGSLLSFAAHSLTGVLAGRLIQGLGVAGPYVSAVSIVRDRYSGRRMAEVMSLVMMIFITVPAIAPSVGQGILLVASWREIFLLYIAYSLVLLGWLALRLEETLPPDRRIPLRAPTIATGFSEVIRNRATMTYTLCMGLCFGSFIGYLNSSQQIFQDQFAVGKLFTLYFGLLALVLGIASLLNARIVGKLGMRRVCLGSFVTITTASALVLGCHLIVPITLPLFLLYAAILFFSFGLVFGNLNAMAMEPMGHIAGIASAIIGSVSSVISMVIGSVIGQLYDNTLVPITTGFFIFGALSLILVVSVQGSDL